MGKAIVYSSDMRDKNRLMMSIESVRKHVTTPDIYLLNSSGAVVDGAKTLDPTPVFSGVGMNDRGWNRHWPFATLNRLAIPFFDELEKYDRVLYLDTDVLVRRPEANLLWDMDLRDYEAFAVSDCEARQDRIPNVMDGDLCDAAVREMSERLWKKEGTRLNAYANAGVVFYCTGNIRSGGIDWYRRRLEWFWEAECRGKFGFLDQDFLNVMMKTSPTLNKRMNWFGGDSRTNCIIQHFVGGSKSGMAGVAKRL